MPDPTPLPAWDGARNLADLGGLPLVGGGRTVTGRVWRSAAPEWMTTAGWRAARAAGLARVVDLRNDRERGRRDHHPRVEPHSTAGVEVVAAPTEDPDDPDFLAECGPWLDHPRSWGPNLDRFPDLAAHALRAVGRAPGPVLVHCAGGRDRTGMVCSLLLALAGVEPDAVASSYEDGFRGAAAHRGHGLSWHPTAGWVEAPDEPWTPAELDAAVAERRPALLDWLAATDAIAWARRAGLDADDVARLRALLRP